MAIRTKGTHLYVIDPTDNSVVRIGCVTSIDGISAPRQTITNQCLEDDEVTSDPGPTEPGQASFEIKFDTATDSHMTVYELWKDSVVTQIAVGLGDGTAPPTVTDGDFVFPDTRSWIAFPGWVVDVPFSIALNENVTTTVPVQMSASHVVIPKVPGGG